MADLSKAREVVAAMPEAQRKEFISRYNSLDADKKQIVVDRLLSRTQESSESKSPELKFQEETEIKTQEPSIVDNAFKYGYEQAGRQTLRTIPGASLVSDLVSPGVAKKIGRVSAPMAASFGLGEIAGVGAVAAVPALASRAFVPSAIKMGIQGAASAQPFNYDSVKSRVLATAGAAVLAKPVAEVVSLGAKGIGLGLEAGSKLVSRIKDPRIPLISRVSEAIAKRSEELSKVSQSLNRQISSSQSEGKEAISQIDERVSSLGKRIQDYSKSYQKSVETSLQNTKSQIEKSVSSLDGELAKESDIAAKTFQRGVTSFFRRNSGAYGKEVDIVGDEIAKSGRLTRGEALDVLTRTLQRSGSEAEINGGPVIDQIKFLIDKKYAAQSVSKAADGTDIINMRDLGERIEFKEFLKDVRGIWKAIKPYQSGARFSADEIPAAILQAETGELISTLPGGKQFESLQAAYRPVISYMNKANSLLQPYRGEAYTKTAEQLVKRYATGKALESDKQLIKFLETGTERFGQGVGNVTAKARQIGENMKVLKASMKQAKLHAEKSILQVAEDAALKLSKIESVGNKAKSLIERETSIRSQQILEEGARQQMILSRQIQRLTRLGKNAEVEKARLKAIRDFTIGLAGVITVTGGVSAAIRGGKNAVQTVTQAFNS